jgi:predicted membrane protein (TIGR00267 family)
MKRRARTFGHQHVLPIVLGLTDGILTALTLVAGRLVAASGSITLGLALRIAAAAAVSSAFILFVARYAELRGELVRAERQLNLTARGRLATTRLGYAVLREAMAAASVASVCSLLGALVPLVAGMVIPGPAWLAIIAAIGALGGVGAGLGRALYGSVGRWALAMVVAGLIVSAAGAKLHIV